MRVLALVSAAAAVAMNGSPAAGAVRDATPSERGVVVAAVNHLRSIGYFPVVPPVVVGVVDGCGRDDVAACVTMRGDLVLSERVASGARRFSAAVRLGGRSARAAAMSSCRALCIDSAMTVIHELVHASRISQGVFRSGDLWEEGLASAVGIDQTPPLVFRVSGLRVNGGDELGCSYCGQVVRVRRESGDATGGGWNDAAARRWRLAAAFVSG